MKLVLMKYLNSKSLPCYRRITEEEAPGSDNDRLEMMELEAEEMLFVGDKKKLCFISAKITSPDRAGVLLFCCFFVKC